MDNNTDKNYELNASYDYASEASDADCDYCVELTHYTESGDDYTEEDRYFMTKAEALKFARENSANVKSVSYTGGEGDRPIYLNY
tara:strand:- start:768 stop:1022 length:255 start_codon:yes stop_codon:yes gene_type:complete